MKKGILITFEGVDWSGKTTQIRLLEKYFNERDIFPVITKEPGGNETGRKIEAILKDPSVWLLPRAELFLFAADRSQHVEEILKPALTAGKLVISDRYYHSTLAYQHYGRGLPFRDVMETIKLAIKGVEPDLTIILDLSLEEAKKRLPKHLDRIEEDMALEKITKGYHEIAKNHPEKVILIDGALGSETVHKNILEIVHKRFPKILEG